jgi:hypothetical protein
MLAPPVGARPHLRGFAFIIRKARRMYPLSLSIDERRAFDWVGDRYAAGRIADLLSGCLSGDDAWDNPGELSFGVPESTAWEIRDLAEAEGFAWPCFAPELAAKLTEFCDRIV